MPSRSPIDLSSNRAILTSFLCTSACDEVLEVLPVSQVILKSTFFVGRVVPISEAEGATVLGGQAVEVTSDAGPRGSNLGRVVWVGGNLELSKGVWYLPY